MKKSILLIVLMFVAPVIVAGKHKFYLKNNTDSALSIDVKTADKSDMLGGSAGAKTKSFSIKPGSTRTAKIDYDRHIISIKVYKNYYLKKTFGRLEGYTGDRFKGYAGKFDKLTSRNKIAVFSKNENGKYKVDFVDK